MGVDWRKCVARGGSSIWVMKIQSDQRSTPSNVPEAHNHNLYDKGEQSLTYAVRAEGGGGGVWEVGASPQQCRYASPPSIRSNGTKHVRDTSLIAKNDDDGSDAPFSLIAVLDVSLDCVSHRTSGYINTQSKGRKATDRRMWL